MGCGSGKLYGQRGRAWGKVVSVESEGAGERKESDEENEELPRCTCADVWRLRTKDRVTDVDSRWSIEVRYMPRDSVVNVDAQMKRGKNRNQRPEGCYKSKYPKTSNEGERKRKLQAGPH